MPSFGAIMPASPSTVAPVAFSDVLALLQPHMAELDRLLHVQIAAFEPEIREFAEYCLDASGKRLRPALVFLSGWRGAESISPDLVRAAAVVEMVHLATLVHDDIMDGADLRRGRRTATRAYGSAAAVLLGDALFAHALHLATQFPTTEVCAAVSESTRRVCAGEIVQTLRRGAIDVTLADYHRIIDLKTAELFRVSCQLGSRLAGYEGAYSSAAAVFGRHLGIAYQIYDDLADFFGEERRIGKTLGTDLASGKLTLPLLALIERLPASEQAGLAAEIRGERPAQFALRLAQMRTHGVFDVVVEAIQLELASASTALAPWPEQAPTPLLAQLADMLRAQVGNLALVTAV
jgi:octaprenyl-diphosphate synthase